MGRNKRIRELKKLAKRYGRTVVEKKGHFRLEPENGNGTVITCSGTPTNADYWLKNVEKDLQKYG